MRLTKRLTDPSLMTKVNGWLTIFWIIMVPLSFFTGWINSVAFLGVISLWALISGHGSFWQSARVEVYQRGRDEAGEVVQRMKDDPDIKTDEGDFQL